MTSPRPCLLLTEDAALFRRAAGLLLSVARVTQVSSSGELEQILDRSGAGVLLMDLRAPGAGGLLPGLVARHPMLVVVALGMPGSEPMHDADGLGIYAAEGLKTDRVHFQALVHRALDHADLLRENDLLRRETTRARVLQEAAPRKDSVAVHPTARQLPGVLRRLENVKSLLEGLAETVANTAMVSRVGIFCRVRESDVYQLRAGLRCLGDTQQIEYGARDPLVRWLTLHAHMVTRANLQHIADTGARLMLGQTLDQFGAEALLPLQARARLLGWLFVGRRVTGVPFDDADLENLTTIADHVSAALENALLYEEVALQKTLAETLLHAMPTGIVAADEAGIVRWFNDAAQRILELPREEVLNRPVEAIGSRLADVLRRSLREAPLDRPVEWMDPRTKRTLVVQTRRLMHRDACLGTVALVHDVTVERMLEEKQDQLERAAFWTELAASMSHEIRNPLVAIKTYAQLLPERYEDAEFRSQFSEIVSGEVDRLNRIIDQINEFAHPRKLQLEPIDVREAARKGLETALRTRTRNRISVETALDPKLPPVLGDAQALSECFAHIITNSVEALASRENPRIVLSAREYKDGDLLSGVAVSVQDNGGGIPRDIREKVFSPFCTTKARGMGLGLPIVKRTVVDHNGRVLIESNDKGTCVSVILPFGAQKGRDETHTDRG